MENPDFSDGFSNFWFTEKRRPTNYYRNPFSKRHQINFTKIVTFSLRWALSVDVWTSYSTTSQYYCPLTARGIWSPYVNGKCSTERKRHDFCEIYLVAFTKGIRRFSVNQKFEKPPEKTGFSIENQKYKVYLFSNHSQRLVFTGPTPGRSNFILGSPAPIWSTGSPSTSLESCNTYWSGVRKCFRTELRQREFRRTSTFRLAPSAIGGEQLS